MPAAERVAGSENDREPDRSNWAPRLERGFVGKDAGAGKPAGLALDVRPANDAPAVQHVMATELE